MNEMKLPIKENLCLVARDGVYTAQNMDIPALLGTIWNMANKHNAIYSMFYAMRYLTRPVVRQ
jgi:hypothetical protein